jgi:hypothetical protein
VNGRDCFFRVCAKIQGTSIVDMMVERKRDIEYIEALADRASLASS